MAATTGFAVNDLPVRVIVHPTTDPTDGNVEEVGTLWCTAGGVGPKLWARTVTTVGDETTAAWTHIL